MAGNSDFIRVFAVHGCTAISMSYNSLIVEPKKETWEKPHFSFSASEITGCNYSAVKHSTPVSSDGKQ